MVRDTVPDDTFSIPGLLRYTFRLYREHFAMLLGITAVIEIPLVVLNLSMVRQFLNVFGSSAPSLLDLTGILSLAGALSIAPALLAGLGAGLLVVCHAAIAIAVAPPRQRWLSTSQAFRRALDYPGSLLMLGLAFALLGLVFGFAARFSQVLFVLAESSPNSDLLAQAPLISGAIFVLAGAIYLWLSVRWLLAPQALVLGRHEGWSSLGRSWQLTGRAWLTLGATWLSFQIVSSAIGWFDGQFLMPLLASFITLGLDLNPALVLPFVDAALFCLVIPLYSIIYALMFIKLEH